MGRRKTVEDETILAAARQIFTTRGHQASTRDVSDAAGISQAVLFQRYKTKQDLFFAAMQPPHPDIEMLLGDENNAQGVSAKAHLTGIACRLLGWMNEVMPTLLHVASHPEFQGFASYAHEGFGADGLVAKLSQRLDRLRELGLIGDHIDTEAVTATLFEALHGQALSTLLNVSVKPGTCSEGPARIIETLWIGIAPRALPRVRRR